MGLSLALISSLQWKKRSRKAMIRVQKRRKGDELVSLEIPLELQIEIPLELQVEIPLELQVEILTRLPAKSLMRFKCVSKLWLSLIHSRYFTNRHLRVAPPPPRLYMSLVDHLETTTSMELCHNPRESVLLSFSNSAKCFDQDLIMPGMGGRIMVILHGLILYTVCRKACIYNPTTRQSLTLPAVKSNIFAQEEYRKSALYFLGYDHVLDQYKVLCTVVRSSIFLERITSEHWVFVLEAGGSWKRIDFDQLHVPARPGVCISGVIYYLASTGYFPRSIVSFDVRSEELNMIQAPLVLRPWGKPVGFIEYSGRPAILDHSRLRKKGMMDLWVLKDGGKWSRESLVLQPCHMHLVDNNIDLVDGATQNGEVIFAPHKLISPYYILCYDLRKNDLRKVEIRGIPDHWFGKPSTNLSFYLKLMDGSESIMHLEI